MNGLEQDIHVRRDDHYPAMPTGIRICDDKIAGGDYFFYRDRQLIVHEAEIRRVQQFLRSEVGLGDKGYTLTKSSAHRPFSLLEFTDDGPPVDTIDLFRMLRFAKGPAQLEPETPKVWPNQVIGLQYHTKWGGAHPPQKPPAPPPGPPGPPGSSGPLPELPVRENSAGAGVRVGVLDTGIEDQDWFDGRWSAAADRTAADVTDEPGSGARLRYQAGHGSFVTGIVLQRAPGAHVVIDRLGDQDGLIDDFELQQRLTALLEPANELDVLNLSLGGYTDNNLPLPLTCDILTAAVDRNPELVIVAAAGNDGHDRPVWPAAMRQVIGVGAVKDGHRCDFSNFGEWVHAWSLGEDLLSTFLRWPPGPPPQTVDLEPGPLDTRADEIHGKRFEGWAIWSGTSFAAARVSGAIAAQLKRDGRSARQVVFDMITNTPFEGGGLIEP